MAKTKKPKKSDPGITKKEIRNKIQDSVNFALATLHLSQPSKKAAKAIKEAAKKIAAEVLADIKKSNKTKKSKKKRAKPVNG